MTRKIADTVTAGGVPLDGVAVTAYKASRFGSTPALGTAPPASPDAGPVTSGPPFGGVGEFEIDCPTSEDYYLHALINGHDTWQFYPLTVGAPGPQGPAGPTGPQGPSGTDTEFTFDQQVPAAVWTITHNLNLRPSVTVVDTAGTEVEGDVAYPDSNHTVLTFAAPFAGTAYLS